MNEALSIIGIFFALGFDAYGVVGLLFYKINQQFGDIMCGPVNAIATIFFLGWSVAINGGGILGFFKNKKARDQFIFTGLLENLPFSNIMTLWTFFVLRTIFKSPKDKSIIFKEGEDKDDQGDNTENDYEESEEENIENDNLDEEFNQ